MSGIHNNVGKVFHKDPVNLVELEGINRNFNNRQSVTTMTMEESTSNGRTGPILDRDTLGRVG